MNYPSITDLNNRPSSVKNMRTVSWSGPLLIRVITRNHEEEIYKGFFVTKIDTKEYTDVESG
ncbi:hypothetical protein [Methanospirillum lacunae]|uniref:Uncharacterized protein n=1 Tax=Methanospirillum lacunae TaxID=668570 RepID=A0A2V2N545_9EURY|nr:hypothetical protein [Methanospirillum lacunae]PWR70631.1 hypothetical protein DK846_14675 [Methanospirillum lacunae]